MSAHVGEALHSAWSALQLRCCDRVGERPRVEGRPHLENWGRIEVGDRFVLRSVPARSHIVAGPGGLLVIGNGVTIEQGAGIAAHGRITIGDGSSIGEFALVMDTNFHKPGNWREAAKPRNVEIGREVRVGERVVVLPGATVGDGAVVAPGSVVVGHVAPGARVRGVPARPAHAAGLLRGDVPGRVGSLFQHAFGLAAPPDPGVRTQAIPGWSLLGGLGLLLDLETEFGVPISDDAWMQVATFQDAIDVVEAACGPRGP